MIGIGEGNTIDIIDSVDFPHSVGIFYTAFTQLLGFAHYGDEYKVMGMAPYGEAKYLDKLNEVVTLTADGLFALNLSYFRTGTQGVITYGDDNTPIVAPLYAEKMIAAARTFHIEAKIIGRVEPALQSSLLLKSSFGELHYEY